MIKILLAAAFLLGCEADKDGVYYGREAGAERGPITSVQQCVELTSTNGSGQSLCRISILVDEIPQAGALQGVDVCYLVTRTYNWTSVSIPCETYERIKKYGVR